jgi:hypothetical protein
MVAQQLQVWASGDTGSDGNNNSSSIGTGIPVWVWEGALVQAPGVIVQKRMMVSL